MATTLRVFTFNVLVTLCFLPLSFSADPQEISPSPPPELGSDSPPPPQNTPEPSPSASPALPPSLNSPPAPTPSDLAPGSSPAPAPGNATDKSPASAPAPASASSSPPPDATDMSHENDADAGDLEANESPEEMKGGQKAGIAIGVIAGICIVGLGALVYKKRRQNIRRAQFGYAARREIL